MLDSERGMSGGGVVERLEGEVVGRAQVAAADLEVQLNKDRGSTYARSALRH